MELQSITKMIESYKAKHITTVLYIFPNQEIFPI